MQVKLTLSVIFTIILTFEAYFFIKKVTSHLSKRALTIPAREHFFELSKALFQLLNGYTLEAIFSL